MMDENQAPGISVPAAALRSLEQLRTFQPAMEAMRQVRSEAEFLRQMTGGLDLAKTLAGYRQSAEILAAMVVPGLSFPENGLSAFHRMVQEVTENRRALEGMADLQKALCAASHMPYWAEMQRSVNQAAAALKRLPLDTIGAAIGLHEIARRTMTENFLHVSDAFWEYNANLGLGDEGLAEMPTCIRKLPLTGYVEDARFLRTISTEAVPRRSTVVSKSSSGPLPRIDRKVVAILRRVNPSLLVFWEEAGQAASSDSPAKGKTVCAQLRTVIQILLVTWAPPTEAFRICGHHEDIVDAKGKGSQWKAQVRYLGGGAASSHSRLLEEQVALVMSCLNEGDHGVESALALKSGDLHALMALVGQSIVALYALHAFLHGQGKE